MKTKKKWVLYVFVHLPLSTMLFLGFFRGCLAPEKKSQIIFYDELIEGKYILYNYFTGDGVGEISINYIAHDKLSLKINARATRGDDKIFDKKFDFKDIFINDISLEKCSDERDDIYYKGALNGIVIIVINIFDENYYKVIPNALLQENRKYYLLSLISDYDYSLIEKDTTSIPLRRIIRNGAYRSIYAGVIYSVL